MGIEYRVFNRLTLCLEFKYDGTKITAPETAEYLLLESDGQMALISGIRYYDPHPSVQGLMQKSIQSLPGAQDSLHLDIGFPDCYVIKK